MGIMQIIIAVIVALFPFFLFCHFGDKITTEFESIGDTAYQIEWYRFPLDMQKDLQVVIVLAQKRIFMRGYGDTHTTYSVFMGVSKKNNIMYL